MLKDVYEILKPLGLSATLGSMSILVGIFLLPGMDYSDLHKVTSTATPYAISLILFILGTGILLNKLWTVGRRAKNFDDVKQKLEKLELEAENKNLSMEEIRLQVRKKHQDMETRSRHARDHLRLFQGYLTLLAKVRKKAKVESADIADAKDVCKSVADHWDEADKFGIFRNFYEISHKMFRIRTALESGLETLIGDDQNEVVEYCNEVYATIASLQREMEIELTSIEDKLFSSDYLISPDSGQSRH
jgi:hypothetical protein